MKLPDSVASPVPGVHPDRRRLLKLAGLVLLTPGTLLAEWLEKAFNAATPAETLAALAPGLEPEEDPRVNLQTPTIAVNGALVPVTVTTDLKNVSRISIIVEKNPNPMAASFDLTPASVPEVSIKLKMNETSPVMAAVEADGKLYTQSREVKVTLGGCGG